MHPYIRYRSQPKTIKINHSPFTYIQEKEINILLHRLTDTPKSLFRTLEARKKKQKALKFHQLCVENPGKKKELQLIRKIKEQEKKYEH